MFKSLILNLLIRKRKQLNISGFTLLELLVSIIIVSIIVGTLLGFLNNILERDRTEQAKVESQEEIQSALNFIANDMTSAVYIYDADGLYRKGTDGIALVTQLPHLQTLSSSGSNTSKCNPTTKKCTPVLAFWKVSSYDRDDQVRAGSSTTPNRAVRCLEEATNIGCTGGNKYYYSLVVYYLLKDDNPNWSSASRIVRWELKDGVIWSCRDPANCPVDTTGSASSQLYIDPDTRTQYAVRPDNGFTRFTLSGVGNLSQQFNNWRKPTAGLKPATEYNYDFSGNPFTELVDFVDDTPFDPTQDDGIIGNTPVGKRIDINIQPQPNITFSSPPVLTDRNESCDNPDIGVGVGLPFAALGTPAQTEFSQRIPPTFDSSATISVTSSTSAQPSPIGLSSFYACVNANKISARVFIRGNALARLKDNIANRPVSDGVFESFLPTSSVKVFGRGVLQPIQ